MIHELEQLQQQIDILKANCDALHTHIQDVGKSIDVLKSGDVPTDAHWIDYIFPPRSNLLRYKCSNCGYICTFQGIKCPRCQVSMR